MRIHRLAFLLALIIEVGSASARGDEASTGAVSLSPLPWFEEASATVQVDPKVRIHVNASVKKEADKADASRLLIYALPNGNTIEQTLGCNKAPGVDWHYDIQHVAAQVRMLRELTPNERLVLVAAEARGLSWPTWRTSRADGNAKIAAFVADWRTRFGGDDAKVTLGGHSGGGSFIFGAIEGVDEVPEFVDRIVFLDSNYAFDATKHAIKLFRWIRGDSVRRLVVIAYDDRNIEFNGKRVVGPDGGTFRATQRMVEAFRSHFPLTQTESPPFTEYAGLEGQVRFFVHSNPQNKILHTALVGDMNGLIHAQTLGTPVEGKWGTFGGPRAYEKWIQLEPTPSSTMQAGGERLAEGRIASGRELSNPFPSSSLRRSGIPARPKDAIGGQAFMQRIVKLDRQQREQAILNEIQGGNVPPFLRRFVKVDIKSGELSGVLEVMPDYLAVGSDEDFIRIPMTPQTAQRIADEFGCVLPTRKMVDAIDSAAEVRLAPQPLTEDRESVAVFLLSNQKIEQQRAEKPLGALTIGGKKDIVLSPRIFERPNRVVIFGWRQLDGKPIQPLTNVHVNWYVDYSHGVRLVRDQMLVEGKPASITELLQDPARAALVSDEGPIRPPRYPVESKEKEQPLGEPGAAPTR